MHRNRLAGAGGHEPSNWLGKLTPWVQGDVPRIIRPPKRSAIRGNERLFRVKRGRRDVSTAGLLHPDERTFAGEGRGSVSCQ
jgi:hypothetical protein